MPESAPASRTARRILEAARKRFEAVGFRRASIGEIAREAGVAAGTIYRHFENKEELLRRIIEQQHAEWLKVARRALAGGGGVAERMARIGLASVEFNQSNLLLSAALSRDAELLLAPLVDELHQRLLEANVALMAEGIREGIADGSVRPVDPERAAYVLFVAGRALFNEPSRPYGEVLPLFLEITQRGLLRDAGDDPLREP